MKFLYPLSILNLLVHLLTFTSASPFEWFSSLFRRTGSPLQTVNCSAGQIGLLEKAIQDTYRLAAAAGTSSYNPSVNKVRFT